MRIAIVNDLSLAVVILRQVLATEPKYELAWVAMDGKEAVEKCAEDTPDLILMDLIMPVMDGVEATRLIMENNPCPILVVTASVGVNASKVFEAMGYGALDAVKTPILDPDAGAKGADVLIRKIEIIAKLCDTRVNHSEESLVRAATPPMATTEFPMLAVGASTGGPRALVDILAALPADFMPPTVIIQHVDRQFSESLAVWLTEQTGKQVRIAKEGMRLSEGEVVLAGTSDHLVMDHNLGLHYTTEPKDSAYRPSIDVFFKSVAKAWPQQEATKGVAVILTGMGHDGAEGLKLLHDLGWHTIAQDQESCIVYGMPKVAVEIGAATEVIPLKRIAESITKNLKGKSYG